MRCCCLPRARASTCSTTTRSAGVASRSWRSRRWGVAREAVAAAAWGAQPEEPRRSRLGYGWEAPLLLLLTIVLLAFGLVMVYSASAVNAQALGLADYHFVVRQALGGAVGMVLLVVLAEVDYHWWGRLAWPLVAVTALALAVLVVPGTQADAPVVNGSRGGVPLGPVTMEPSEVAKLVLIACTAKFAVKKREMLSSLSRGLMPFLVIWGLIALLGFLEPALPSALLIVLLAALVVLAAGSRIGPFLLLGLVGLPLQGSQVESVQSSPGDMSAH